jgi:cell division protein FtsW (lipid II flippase)
MNSETINLFTIISQAASLTEGLFPFVIMIARMFLPILAVWLLGRCGKSMLSVRYEPETWGYFVLPTGERLPLRHWECTLGRSKSSDIIVDYPEVSRLHGVIIRDDKGYFTVYDLNSTGGTKIGRKTVTQTGTEIIDGNTLALAGVKLSFIALSDGERISESTERRTPDLYVSPGKTLFILTAFICILTLCHSISAEPEYLLDITLAFAVLLLSVWIYYLIMRSIRRSGFEIEAIAFFLCALGFSVAATSVPEDISKQSLLYLAGFGLYLILGWILRDLRRANSLRWFAGAGALALLALNLLLGEEIFGQRNWIIIFGFSLQPSEFVKVAYIFAGSATLERLYMGRNLFLFIVFSAVCVGVLALIGDFGAAVIFFATFLTISFLRSGNLATIFLAVSGAGLAGMIVMTIKPYIAQRFATWGHVWEHANTSGYQQTRALTAIASGGFFGQGAGNGWMQKIAAADTDLVFAVVSEELGLIVAVSAVVSIIMLCAFILRNAPSNRSSFYVIAACSAVAMFMTQTGLNVFGSLDILPLTGVTFPFVSRGGSSLIACWGLLAFIKASDTRQNASFIVRLPSRRKAKRDEWDDDEDWDDEDMTDVPDGFEGEAE